MPDPSLSLLLADFQSEVGTFLGYGRGTNGGDTAWDTRQSATITSIVASGLRQFYFPALDNGATYQWSFLQPEARLTLDSGARSLLLPADFGGFAGRLSVESDSGTITRWTIPLVGLGSIQERYSAMPDNTGRPEIACDTPIKGTSLERGQRRELKVWPEADAEYTLVGAYNILPNFLDGMHPYAYGGAAHSETILESCLSIAEQRLDDKADVHTMKYRERLMASIAIDQRSKPQVLGYNGDRSDMRGRRWGSKPQYWYDTNSVTVNGVEY